jgi:2-C-methyl-D-erythritol 4-phosphate cytidylyltransferase
MMISNTKQIISLAVFYLLSVSSAFVLQSSSLLHQLASSKSQVKASSDEESTPDMGNIGFVLLAGGTGSRMKASMPKQYLPLRGIPVLHYSLDLFLNRLPEYCESKGVPPPEHVVLVMDPSYQPEYQPIIDKFPEGRLSFANPGEERQGSVENGLNKLVEVSGGKCTFAAIHDSARPLVTIEEICGVVEDAQDHGAAVLGVPCKATIKESEDGAFVLRTIPRARLWEVHTPQVVNIDTLLRGFKKVEEKNLEVTDDVSIVEALGESVKLTRGEYTNLKITTPEDMDVAEAILEERKSKPVNMLD